MSRDSSYIKFTDNRRELPMKDLMGVHVRWGKHEWQLSQRALSHQGESCQELTRYMCQDNIYNIDIWKNIFLNA
jgi:hypothetical protein